MKIIKKVRIFNPLDHLKPAALPQEVTASDNQESTSAFYNEVVGTCPKCQQPMITSTIANGDTMFFCTRDRVVLPRPDSMGV